MLKTGDINEGDVLTFGNDPNRYKAGKVEVVNGEIVAIEIKPVSAPESLLP